MIDILFRNVFIVMSLITLQLIVLIKTTRLNLEDVLASTKQITARYNASNA